MTKERWVVNLERRANEHLLRADIAHSEGNYALQLEECKKAEEYFELRDTLNSVKAGNSNGQE